MRIIDADLLAVIRREPCAWPDCHRPGPCQAHHFMARGQGGCTQMDIEINVLPLCLVCHTTHHNGGRPDRSDLLALLASRTGLLQDEVLNALYSLRRRAGTLVVSTKASRTLRGRHAHDNDRRRAEVLRVQELSSHPEVGEPAYRLTPDGMSSEASYDVIATVFGLECSCPDWNYRHRNDGKGCKHIDAMLATGFFRWARK